ncbi:hypothetical protein FBEOM_1704 [Fusarium beomiforme]|uniref:Uncharacterized protein n=1 Tax=Fusarium beomiforme TaxID=44412 RepID=A0A9P5ASR7_9HYPO|nr:hypothetical protein FBEOM_1704 [Fusarium beomiforme]
MAASSSSTFNSLLSLPSAHFTFFPYLQFRLRMFKSHLEPVIILQQDDVPVNLMTAEFKNHLFYNSNGRLEEAKQQGIDLKDIVFGNDCLPTWASRTWDSEYETLHEFLQHDLLSLHEALTAGILGAAAEQAVQFLPKQNDEGSYHSSSDSDIVEHTGTSGGTISHENAGTPDADISMNLHHLDLSDSDYDSDIDSDVSESEISFVMIQNDGNPTNDEDEGNTIFDPEPMYDDSDDDEQHIFHGAELVGFPGQQANTDLEVYIAEDDEDIQDLPKMELVVDQESYERVFGIDGAIELEIVGGRLICTGELYEEDQEMVLEEKTDDMTNDMADVSLVDLDEEL